MFQGSPCDSRRMIRWVETDLCENDGGRSHPHCLAAFRFFQIVPTALRTERPDRTATVASPSAIGGVRGVGADQG